MEKAILLVDDEAGIRKVLGIALSDMGYRVRTAANGVEALRIFKDELPPIVLIAGFVLNGAVALVAGIQFEQILIALMLGLAFGYVLRAALVPGDLADPQTAATVVAAAARLCRELARAPAAAVCTRRLAARRCRAPHRSRSGERGVAASGRGRGARRRRAHRALLRDP